jgi:hypothetical protein
VSRSYPGARNIKGVWPARDGASHTRKRDHGDPQSFRLHSEGKGKLVRRRDLNPHGPCGPTDFYTLLRLSPPPTAFAMGFGVWTIPSPCPDLAPGGRCCRSSLYTFPAVFGPGLARDCPVKDSPILSSSASPVSRRALKFTLKSDASADSATPAWFQGSNE